MDTIQSITLVGLKWKEQSDTVHVLVDESERIAYGRAFLEDGKIQMASMSENNLEEESHGMAYKIEEIGEIYKSEGDLIQVFETNGTKAWAHRGQPYDEVVRPLPPNEDWNLVDNIRVVKAAFKYNFPGYKEWLFYDILGGGVTLNKRIFGQPTLPGIPEITTYGGKGSTDMGRFMEKLNNWKVTIIDGRTGNPKEKYFEPKDKTLDLVIRMVAEENPSNSFLRYIEYPAWDGEERAKHLLTNAHATSGLEDPEDNRKYCEALSEAIFLAALQRQHKLMNIIDPNVKEEPITFLPILIGVQSSGKSLLCEAISFKDMAGTFENKGWYGKSETSFEDKKKFWESASGCVLLELKESKQMENDSASSIKTMIEIDDIKFRQAYAATSGTVPLSFTMIATTNTESVLKDPTGARRMYPAYMYERNGKGVEYLKELKSDRHEVQQMWAEMLVKYRNGYRWNSAFDKMDEIVLKVQKGATQPFVGQEEIADYLRQVHPEVGSYVLNDELVAMLEGRLPQWIDAVLKTYERTPKMEKWFEEIERIENTAMLFMAEYTSTETKAIMLDWRGASAGQFGFEKEKNPAKLRIKGTGIDKSKRIYKRFSNMDSL